MYTVRATEHVDCLNNRVKNILQSNLIYPVMSSFILILFINEFHQDID